MGQELQNQLLTTVALPVNHWTNRGDRVGSADKAGSTKRTRRGAADVSEAVYPLGALHTSPKTDVETREETGVRYGEGSQFPVQVWARD